MLYLIFYMFKEIFSDIYGGTVVLYHMILYVTNEWCGALWLRSTEIGKLMELHFARVSFLKLYSVDSHM